MISATCGKARRWSRESSPPSCFTWPGAGATTSTSSPEPRGPADLEALIPAVEAGLNVPLVYNTGGYDSIETLKLLDGVSTSTCPTSSSGTTSGEAALSCRRLPRAGDGGPAGDAPAGGGSRDDEAGVATRGLLVRHLVMPGGVAGTDGVMRFWPRRSRGTPTST